MREGRADARERGLEGSAPVLAAAFLIVAVGLAGGSSVPAPARSAALALIAIAVGVAAARALLRSGPLTPMAAALLGIGGLAALIGLCQLVPLPVGLWARLPGGPERLEALALAGAPRGPLPASLDPQATAWAVVAVLAPAAMALAMLAVRAPQARRLIVLWMLVAVAGLILGAIQLAAGGSAAFHFYRETNAGSLTGFFANRNHEAALLLALIPLAAALAGARANHRGRWNWLGGLFIVLAVIGLGAVRSRAGIVLAVPALVGSLALAWPGRRRRGPIPLALGVLAVGLAAAAVAWSGAWPILDRFAADPGADLRFRALPTVVAVTKAQLPFGAGLGAFDRVYRAAEPLRLVQPTYFNHAHDDLLEYVLEAGWAGAAVIALFLAWFLAAAWRAWRPRGGGEGRGLARAASLSIALLLAASGVDYPLRTPALAGLFAFCCALLARGPAGPEAGR